MKNKDNQNKNNIINKIENEYIDKSSDIFNKSFDTINTNIVPPLFNINFEDNNDIIYNDGINNGFDKYDLNIYSSFQDIDKLKKVENFDNIIPDRNNQRKFDVFSGNNNYIKQKKENEYLFEPEKNRININNNDNNEDIKQRLFTSREFKFEKPFESEYTNDP